MPPATSGPEIEGLLPNISVPSSDLKTYSSRFLINISGGVYMGRTKERDLYHKNLSLDNLSPYAVIDSDCTLNANFCNFPR